MTTATRPLRKWTVQELDALHDEAQAWFAAHDGEPNAVERYMTILQFIEDLSERTPEWWDFGDVDALLARIRRMTTEASNGH